MKTNKHFSFDKKTFLTLEPLQDSAICAGIRVYSFDSKDAKKNTYYHDANIRIQDCSRNINIEFELDEDNDLNQRLEKLDTMIDILNQFRSALIESDSALKQLRENQSQ